MNEHEKIAIVNLKHDDSPVFDHIRRDKIEALLSKQDLPNSKSKFLFNFVNSKIFIEKFS